MQIWHQNFGPKQGKWAKVFLDPNYKTWVHMRLGPEMGQRALHRETQLLAHLQNRGHFLIQIPCQICFSANGLGLKCKVPLTPKI
jgi:hypothetical protein